MKRHALERTSPKGPGQPYIGKCTKCGAQNVTIEQMRNDECPNPYGISDDSALIGAILGPQKRELTSC